jgi:hypothetical protein
MHLVQAFTRFPETKRTHCKLGYFLTLVVGLYLPLSFFFCQTRVEVFPQMEHFVAMVFLNYLNCEYTPETFFYQPRINFAFESPAKRGQRIAASRIWAQRFAYFQDPAIRGTHCARN